MTTRQQLILDAQRKGFGVTEDDTGWLVSVPARPRRPASLQGSYANPERAWMAACLFSRDFPDP